jgi:hypothetical protein
MDAMNSTGTRSVRPAPPDLESELVALTDQLNAGWDWLRHHQAHPQHEAFISRWLDRLRTYEQTSRVHAASGRMRPN